MVALTNPANLVVVITGCDTGFGSEIVEDLYNRNGYTVYATCLTEKSVEGYNARQSSRLRAVQVDVTNQDDVNRLRAQVEAECPQGVYCVLNNAGRPLLFLRDELATMSMTSITSSVGPPHARFPPFRYRYL